MFLNIEGHGMSFIVMTALKDHLELSRCPRCAIARPLLARMWDNINRAQNDLDSSFTATYRCSSCRKYFLAEAIFRGSDYEVRTYPQTEDVSESVPERAREYLGQALQSIHVPSGAVMLAASAVDAMLRAKGLKDGVLHDRIKKAVSTNLITAEMGEWAHEVRLEANAQRHADDDFVMPTSEDALHTLEFAKALAQFLFVLPAAVARGRGKPAPPSNLT